MPSIQVLQGIPGFEDQLGQRIGEGFGTGFQQGLSQSIRDYYERQQNINKALEGRHKATESYLKTRDESLYQNPKLRRQYEDLYEKKLREGIAPNVALVQAQDEVRKKGFGSEQEQIEKQRKNLNVFDVIAPGQRALANTALSQYLRDIGANIQQTVEIGKEEGLKEPSLFARALPVGALKLLENTVEQLTGQGFLSPESQGIFGPIGNKEKLKKIATSYLSEPEKELANQPSAKKTLSDIVSSRSLKGIPENKKEDAKKGLEALSDIYEQALGIAIPEGILAKENLAARNLSKLEKARKLASLKSTADKVRAIKPEIVQPGKATKTQKPVATSSKSQQSISKEAPRTKTSVAAERAFEETPKASLLKEKDTIERQLRDYPRYKIEIARDATERAERLADQQPKTEKGMISQQARRMKAQEAIPEAQKAYTKAAARLREIEDAYRLGSTAEREQLKPLLDASRRSYNEAANEVNTLISNARSGKSKAPLAQNTKRAQEKVLQWKEEIAEGKTPQLSKADYNPEFIKKAEQLDKRKLKIESTAKDTFFENVHGQYGDVYKKELKKIDDLISVLEKEKASGYQQRQLKRYRDEKELLEKALKHIEAENKIHRHKLALRQMAERQKLRQSMERFKSQPKGKAFEAGQKALENYSPESAAKSLFEKERIKAEKVFDKSKEKLKDSPKARIKKENIEAAEKQATESLKDIKETVSKDAKDLGEKVKEKVKEKGADSKEAEKIFKDSTKGWIKKWGNLVDNFLAKTPGIGKYELGRDALRSVIGIIADTFNTELDLGLPSSTYVNIALGKNAGRGFGSTAVRSILNGLIKRFGIDYIRKKNIQAALEKGDTEKLQSYKKKYNSKLYNKAIQDFRS